MQNTVWNPEQSVLPPLYLCLGVQADTAMVGGRGSVPEQQDEPIEIDYEAYNHSKAAYAGMARTDPQVGKRLAASWAMRRLE